MLICDCPRCGAKRITFDTLGCIPNTSDDDLFEVFGSCRSCHTSTVFLVRNISQNSFKNLMEGDFAINNYIEVEGVVNLVPVNSSSVPKHLPGGIEKPFREALSCSAIQAWNAAGCMFRTTVDLATKEQLQKLQKKKPPKDLKQYLAKRIDWLFDIGHISEKLKDLSTCIRKDGNDAAHEANLGKEDIEDVCDFTTLLLEELYTTPVKIQEAIQRQQHRQNSKVNETEA